jgi:hypothetical protein
MLDTEFKKQRAQTARELAAIATDRFTKRRLLDLAARYEDDDSPARSPLTPIDLKFKSHGTGSSGRLLLQNLGKAAIERKGRQRELGCARKAKPPPSSWIILVLSS